MQLSETGRRVLGCLVEKALATPQQYPLSANALTGACNQSTGRDPVVSWDEPTALTGIDDLKGHQLVRVEYARGSRTPKYAHRLDEQLDLAVDQQAVLALLLLRGPQTVGELRGRSERLHGFDSLEAVEETLTSLADHRFGSLAAPLPRQPGQKEIRWTHLLAAPADAAPAPTAAVPDEVPAADPDQRAAAPVSPPSTGVDDVEARLETLETRIDALEAQLADTLDRLDRALG